MDDCHRCGSPRGSNTGSLIEKVRLEITKTSDEDQINIKKLSIQAANKSRESMESNRNIDQKISDLECLIRQLQDELNEMACSNKQVKYECDIEKICTPVERDECDLKKTCTPVEKYKCEPKTICTPVEEYECKSKTTCGPVEEYECKPKTTCGPVEEFECKSKTTCGPVEEYECKIKAMCVPVEKDECDFKNMCAPINNECIPNESFIFEYTQNNTKEEGEWRTKEEALEKKDDSILSGLERPMDTPSHRYPIVLRDIDHVQEQDENISDETSFVYNVDSTENLQENISNIGENVTFTWDKGEKEANEGIEGIIDKDSIALMIAELRADINDTIHSLNKNELGPTDSSNSQ